MGSRTAATGAAPAAAAPAGHRSRLTVGKPPAGVPEPARHGVEPHRLDGVEEGAGPGLAARQVRRVVRVQPAVPGGDRHLGGEPGRDQVGQQRGLLVLQRRHRHIAADQHLGRVDRVVAAVQHVRHGHGEVADQRRVGHVAEVHDPADPQIVVEQHVVQAHVAVDHLGAQARQHRLDPGLEPVQHPLHLSPARGVGDVAEQRPELGRVGEVPQDLVVGRGMEEPPQRPPQPGRGLPDGPDRLGGERRVRGHPPGQEREQPHRVVPAVGPAHLGPGLPHRVRQDPHHRQARVHPLDVAERGGLHLHDGQAVRRVGDLEQEAPPVGGVHPEVLVAFARERGERR